MVGTSYGCSSSKAGHSQLSTYYCCFSIYAKDGRFMTTCTYLFFTAQSTNSQCVGIIVVILHNVNGLFKTLLLHG